MKASKWVPAMAMFIASRTDPGVTRSSCSTVGYGNSAVKKTSRVISHVTKCLDAVTRSTPNKGPATVNVSPLRNRNRVRARLVESKGAIGF
jgi:hypothetical protein